MNTKDFKILLDGINTSGNIIQLDDGDRCFISTLFTPYFGIDFSLVLTKSKNVYKVKDDVLVYRRKADSEAEGLTKAQRNEIAITIAKRIKIKKDNK